ncbi:MAG: carboxymuconolactone decarboxylase family protein [Candidatus Altiarchaeales archaeon]|nr:MAG: carboxymuconolactone decarboxylase family protein [Candidatus Altiarchaeales archaeon]RLI93680.1 MAG: carboxymuconolactone decarboxylase family protein [Candidatus Altiarchaeales archaeon]RLI94411.1 MAG: carboxymuconolactone decarboxylase family protein [Candidatus Altiarchaeales archaeon]HDO81968.1 carboxymuconolactone decarboxylase family protein [Candidatus Altiarchaeales archaeon]HEX54617.1 carboxymuconolactone decarboxylase family protein [Candidatus Altiarchaeales archaeon]
MKERLEEAKNTMEILSKEYPRLQSPFGVLKRHAVEEDGALPAKIKKMIALAIALADGCEWCIAIHTKGALEAGATKDELIEAAYVAVLMAGGPALTHICKLLEAIDEFSQD